MSKALKAIQTACGVTADGAFGPNTARAIAKRYKLSSARAAHLMGQAAHESAGFTVSEENLNYRASTMRRVWPSRFKSLAEAEPFARNPERLANKVYGGRMGNDDAGDGWKYRGRGFIQLTGKSNYRLFAHDIGRDAVLDNPDLVATDLAMDSAIWFFEKNGLFTIADQGIGDTTIAQITKRVNGGHHGLADRADWTRKIYAWLD